MPEFKNMGAHKDVICLVGPTAVGKTNLSIELAGELGTEIISADSRQVYKLMNIGTAKPSAEQMALVRHHMIDLVFPDEKFDAGYYERMAAPVVSRILEEGRSPLVTGGTGLYVKSLLYGLVDSPASDPELRRSLLSQDTSCGGNFLYSKLKEVDSISAQRIHPNDKSKLLRALEVFYSTGRPISLFQGLHRFKKKRYNTITIGLRRRRDILYSRIEDRVWQMIEAGFIEEVEQLLDLGYDETLSAMSSLGYSQISGFLKKRHSRDTAIALMIRDTKRYAKRQFTWFNKMSGLVWVDLDIDENWALNKLLEVIFERRGKCQEQE